MTRSKPLAEAWQDANRARGTVSATKAGGAELLRRTGDGCGLSQRRDPQDLVADAAVWQGPRDRRHAGRVQRFLGANRTDRGQGSDVRLVVVMSDPTDVTNQDAIVAVVWVEGKGEGGRAHGRTVARGPLTGGA
jgi:hypothetical protein